MNKKINVKVYFNIIIGILFISFLVNVYMALKENSYKKRTYLKSYNSIQEIWNKNIDVNKILEVVVKDGKIKKSELIKLKQNYDIVLDKSVSLMDDYTFYSNDETFHIGADDTIKDTSISDNYKRIKPYLNKLVEDSMCVSNEYIDIKGKNCIYFNKLNDLSKDINSYYEDLTKKNSKDGSFDGLKDKLSKKEFLDEVYESLNKINLKYKDVDFSIQAKK